MEVEAGYRIELVACEPQVVDPGDADRWRRKDVGRGNARLPEWTAAPRRVCRQLDER